MYEDLIGYILDGYSNKELKKIIQQKRIKITGVREVNDRTRVIVLKNLKTKSNLFELYKLWSSSKNKSLEQSEIHKLSFEKIINDINLGKLNSLEGPSNYLLSLIKIDGFEKAIHFWETNKDRLEKIRLTGEIEIKDEEKKEIDNDSIIENHLKELTKLEKKQSKERVKWQSNETKMNKLLKQRDNEILNLQKDRKELQKKYSNTLDELKKKLETDKSDTKEMNSLLDQRDRLQIEFEKMKIKNNDLKQENIKKYEFIGELKDTIILNMNEIKKLNQLIQKQKNNEILLEPTSAILDVEVAKDRERQNSEVSIVKQSVSSIENVGQVVKEEVSPDKLAGGSIRQEEGQKKILVFGDITGLNYKENLFEIYTSNMMPEDISILDEDDYEVIWLIKYRFTKKGQRNLVLKKFQKVKVINNFIELEGAYKNELQI